MLPVYETANERNSSWEPPVTLLEWSVLQWNTVAFTRKLHKHSDNILKNKVATHFFLSLSRCKYPRSESMQPNGNI